MSSSEDVANEVASDYAFIVATTILVYDTLQTISDEVELLWQTKFKLPAAFYILTRYPLILVCVVDWILTFVPMEITACTKVLAFENAFFFLAGLGVHGLLFLRAYAVSDRNRWLLAGLCFPVLIASAIKIAQSVISSCDLLTDAQQKKIRIECDINNASILALDTIVIVITIYYVVGRQSVRFSWRTDSTDLSLRANLLKHGVIQYLWILTFGLTGIVATAISSPLGPILMPITNSMTSILMCHFLLDIRMRNKHSNAGYTPLSPTVSRVQTAIQHFDAFVMDGFGETIASSSSQDDGDPEETTLEEGHTQNTRLMIGSIEQA